MGFTSALVGLGAYGGVTGHFREARPTGCPHKGTDISSGGSKGPFLAGIYGKVVPPHPADSQWCTIAVQPFHDPSATVQYLHASKTNVKPGDVVAPWTVLGETGNCSPTPVPIHLHLQVAYQRPPSEACWGNRDFVDPEAWHIRSPLIGTWSNQHSGPNYISFNTTEINNEGVGRVGKTEANVRWTWKNRKGILCNTSVLYTYDCFISGFAQPNVVLISSKGTSATVTDSPCGPFNPGKALDANVPLIIDSLTRARIGAHEWAKSGLTLYESDALPLVEGEVLRGDASHFAMFEIQVQV